jgi:hypothetical protein
MGGAQIGVWFFQWRLYFLRELSGGNPNMPPWALQRWVWRISFPRWGLPHVWLGRNYRSVEIADMENNFAGLLKSNG